MKLVQITSEQYLNLLSIGAPAFWAHNTDSEEALLSLPLWQFASDDAHHLQMGGTLVDDDRAYWMIVDA